MIASPEPLYLTEAEYLQMEEHSPIKHEYIDGQIFAMAGASDAHVTIAGNLFALLRNHVRGSGCCVYISDMQVRLEALNRFYYPDVVVTRDERDRYSLRRCHVFRAFRRFLIQLVVATPAYFLISY